MNKAILVGRLTKDPELKTTASGTSVCAFTLAVQRKFKNQKGNYEADFINCAAWRGTAEFICKYFEKGSLIGVTGSIQTRNYEKDGSRVYITEVIVDEAEFVESKRQGSEVLTAENPGKTIPDVAPQSSSFADGFMPMPDDDDLPF